MAVTASAAQRVRKPYQVSPIFYHIVRLIVAGIMHVLFRYRVHGRQNVPPSGPAILAVNHLHFIDPGAVAPAIRRQLVTLAADKWQTDRFTNIFLHIAGVIYVRRGEVDRQALRDCLEVLASGWLLAMAPEGTRSKTGGLQQGRAGVAYLASKANVPIVPLAFWGTERVREWKLFKRPRCEVTIGEPFYLPTYEGKPPTEVLDHWADLVMLKIGLMLPPSYRGIYAERIAAIERGESHELDGLRPALSATTGRRERA